MHCDVGNFWLNHIQRFPVPRSDFEVDGLKYLDNGGLIDHVFTHSSRQYALAHIEHDLEVSSGLRV